MPLIRHYGDRASCRRRAAEAALIVSTYQKPRHLRLSLTSIARQEEVHGKFELVVADDGSTDETFEIVERFAATVDFPVALTSHRHSAFQVAQCRNEGVAASAAPYLIFADGDLILPPDFVWQHLARRGRNTVRTGDCYRLTEEQSAGMDEAIVRSGAYRELVSAAEVRRVRRADRLSWWQALVRYRRGPQVLGGNLGLWRCDLERVNGYDENFQGWGCEDDDLGHRLRRSGVQVRWINHWTCAYHIWHPAVASKPAEWIDGPNAAYYLRRHRQYRCLNGLRKPEPAMVKIDDPSARPETAAGIPLATAPRSESDQRRYAA